MQETVSGNGISCATRMSAPRSRQPRQHPTALFRTGRMPFLPPNQQRQSTHTHARLMAFVRDYPGEPVPER